jgi:L-alanine-DL-glutamate epimerase-like enolase superfamily enzyme
VDSLNTAQENVLVQVETDAGIIGIGEVESNPWAIKALIDSPSSNILSRSLSQLVMGLDPTQPRLIWDRLYRGSIVSGRRGAGICAIGAIDMAIWDIYGKATGQPIWHLLGGSRQRSVTPYASLLPSGQTLQAYQQSLLEKALWAQDFGFRAVKLEILIKGPCSHNGWQASDEAIVEMVGACRESLGPTIRIMVDVGYAWDDWKVALNVLNRLEKYDIYFVETPLWTDDLDGYAALSGATEIPVAAGELLQTRFEFGDLLDRGHIDIVQPDIGRVGGITEALRVVQMAQDRGKSVIPHCWRSGIGIAATAHVALASGNCPFIEFLPSLPSESALRRELLLKELPVESGQIWPPSQAGLGVVLDTTAVARFSEAAQKAVAGKAGTTE